MWWRQRPRDTTAASGPCAPLTSARHQRARLCLRRSLDLTGPLLLGGVPNLPEDFPVRSRQFVGCMRNLSIDGRSVDMASFIANNGTRAGRARLPGATGRATRRATCHPPLGHSVSPGDPAHRQDGLQPGPPCEVLGLSRLPQRHSRAGPGKRGPPPPSPSSLLPGCAAQRNFCEGTWCQNGGTCVSRWDTHLCRCPLRFGGKNCEHGEPGAGAGGRWGHVGPPRGSGGEQAQALGGKRG